MKYVRKARNIKINYKIVCNYVLHMSNVNAYFNDLRNIFDIHSNLKEIVKRFIMLSFI